MNRNAISILAAAACLLCTSTLAAKEYTDYSPGKGVWRISAIEVDPNHMDEYLTGLRTSQVPGFDVMKRRGIIDEYRYVAREGYVKGSPNLLIEVHFTSFAMLDPNQKRDQAIEKEIYAAFSEEAGKTAVAGYEKYRSFVETGLWSEVVIAK